MVSCSISNCGNSSKTCNTTNEGITFHRFPRTPDVKEDWIKATGKKKWSPSVYSRICSVHFKEDDFNITAKRRTLMKTAVPTVDIWKPCTSTDNLSATTRLNSSGRHKQPAGNRLLPAQAFEVEELKTSREKKLLTEHRRNQRMIAEQRLKIKRLQVVVRRYRKKMFQLKDLSTVLSGTSQHSAISSLGGCDASSSIIGEAEDPLFVRESWYTKVLKQLSASQ